MGEIENAAVETVAFFAENLKLKSASEMNRKSWVYVAKSNGFIFVKQALSGGFLEVFCYYVRT
jgi:hypothetical protein